MKLILILWIDSICFTIEFFGCAYILAGIIHGSVLPIIVGIALTVLGRKLRKFFNA